MRQGSLSARVMSATDPEASSPFAVLVDPGAALKAYVRLEAALAGRCVRWSPLGKPAIQPLLEESDAAEDAGPM